LIVVIVPLSVVGLYLTSNADSSLQQTVGMYFRTMAQTEAASTSQFISGRIVDVQAVAGDPNIVDAVTAANRSYGGMSEDAVAARIQKIEEQWDTPNADLLVKEMMSSRASRWLQHQRALKPQLLKIIVADENGARVAATEKPLHYAESDKEHWQAIYAHGNGAVNVTDVRYDERTQFNYVSVAVPVLEEGSGRFIGAVSALVDISGLFSLLDQQLSRTGRILLVKGSGTIISAPKVTPDLKIMSEEFGAVRDALGTMEGRQTGYLTGCDEERRLHRWFRRYWAEAEPPQFGLAYFGESGGARGFGTSTYPGAFCPSYGCAQSSHADRALGLLLDAPPARVGRCGVATDS
jgi:hypothetical protein